MGRSWEGVKTRETQEFRALFKDRGQFWVMSWKPAKQLYGFVPFEI